MEKLDQSMIARLEVWSMVITPPLGEAITAEPATTFPDVGSTGEA
jgi:hypothetical protein